MRNKDTFFEICSTKTRFCDVSSTYVIPTRQDHEQLQEDVHIYECFRDVSFRSGHRNFVTSRQSLTREGRSNDKFYLKRRMKNVHTRPNKNVHNQRQVRKRRSTDDPC